MLPRRNLNDQLKCIGDEQQVSSTFTSNGDSSHVVVGNIHKLAKDNESNPNQTVVAAQHPDETGTELNCKITPMIAPETRDDLDESPSQRRIYRSKVFSTKIRQIHTCKKQFEGDEEIETQKKARTNGIADTSIRIEKVETCLNSAQSTPDGESAIHSPPRECSTPAAIVGPIRSGITGSKKTEIILNCETPSDDNVNAATNVVDIEKNVEDVAVDVTSSDGIVDEALPNEHTDDFKNAAAPLNDRGSEFPENLIVTEADQEVEVAIDGIADEALSNEHTDDFGDGVVSHNETEKELPEDLTGIEGVQEANAVALERKMAENGGADFLVDNTEKFRDACSFEDTSSCRGDDTSDKHVNEFISVNYDDKKHGKSSNFQDDCSYITALEYAEADTQKNNASRSSGDGTSNKDSDKVVVTTSNDENRGEISGAVSHDGTTEDAEVNVEHAEADSPAKSSSLSGNDASNEDTDKIVAIISIDENRREGSGTVTCNDTSEEAEAKVEANNVDGGFYEKTSKSSGDAVNKEYTTDEIIERISGALNLHNNSEETAQVDSPEGKENQQTENLSTNDEANKESEQSEDAEAEEPKLSTQSLPDPDAFFSGSGEVSYNTEEVVFFSGSGEVSYSAEEVEKEEYTLGEVSYSTEEEEVEEYTLGSMTEESLTNAEYDLERLSTGRRSSLLADTSESTEDDPYEQVEYLQQNSLALQEGLEYLQQYSLPEVYSLEVQYNPPALQEGLEYLQQHSLAETYSVDLVVLPSESEDAGLHLGIWCCSVPQTIIL